MQKIINHTDIKPYFLKIFIPIVILFFIQNIVCSQEDDVKNYKIRTVVIDPGHGGQDPGALGSRVKEKDIVLAISLKLGAYIQEYFPEIKVIYTRSEDVFIPLHERAEIANKANADLFISIHANSNPNSRAYGTETFVMGLHKTEENLQVAMKENSVITFEEDYEVRYEGFNPNNVESYIMISLMQDTYLEQSLSAASLIQDQFRERAVRKDRGVKQAGFLVLWQTSMPSILIETGFLSNPNEENYLASEQGQDHLASAVFRAFRDYKQDIESRSATLTVFENHPDSTGSAPAKPQSEEGSVISKGENIYYKVQISASSTSIPLNAADFNGFGDVEEFRQNNIYKYAVGSKKNYDEILEFSKQVKTNYPDAFIIAVKNGKIIPVTEALKQGNPN